MGREGLLSSSPPSLFPLFPSSTPPLLPLLLTQETLNTSCPSIRPHPLTTNYLIHTNHTYSHNQLEIEAENLFNFRQQFQQDQFRCVICAGSNCLFNLSASINPEGTQVTCEGREFRYSGSEAIVNASLRVVWNINNRNLDNPGNAGGMLCSYSL